MEQYIALTLILSLGIFVQASAGFAAGLIIIPLLLWSGFTLQEAQASMLVATIPQNCWGVYSLRRSISVQRVAWPGVARVLFLPLGCALLYQMQSFPKTQMRQIVGLVVLVVTVAIIFFRPKPRQSLHPAWAWLSFPLSGFLQGLVGMGGPAMVFWVQAHDWETREVRGFLFAMYLISIVPALCVLYAFFGTEIIQPALVAGATIPVLLLVTMLGLKFGDWLGKERLRRITYFLLLLIGLAGVLSPYLSRASTPASDSVTEPTRESATEFPAGLS